MCHGVHFPEAHGRFRPFCSLGPWHACCLRRGMNHASRFPTLRFAALPALVVVTLGIGVLANACGGTSGVRGGEADAGDGGGDAADTADATSETPPFGACTKVDEPAAVCAGLCGNGRADSCLVGGGGGPGPGPTQVTEACDGADLGGKTCESKGYLGGLLRCSATCTIEVAGCTSTRDAFSTIDLAGSAGMASSASRGASVAVAWANGRDGLVHLGLVVERRLVESDVCFGSLPPIRLDLVATVEGFALMSSYSGALGTDVFRLDPSGKVLGTRRFAGLALAELKTRSADGGPGEGTLLVGQKGIVTEVRWLRADLTDAYEPQTVDVPGSSHPHNALSFGDTILLVSQTNDSKLAFTRLLPDCSQTKRVESGMPFTSGWAGRRGDLGLLTRFYSSEEVTLEAFDASGTPSGVVRKVPGLMFPPRVLELDGRSFAITATSDASGASSVAAHSLDGAVEARPLMHGPDARVVGASAPGDLVVQAGGALRLLAPK